MKNKTIFDAVNELHGEVLGSDVRHIITRPSTGQIILWSLSDLDALNTPTWSHLCSIEEFNALVEEMKLGLDVNEITERMFHCYKYNAKELLEPVGNIDWDNAPDWALHYAAKAGMLFWLGGEHYSYVDSNPQVKLEYKNPNFTCNRELSEFKVIESRPTIVAQDTNLNTYTQEMADNGVLPSVGMECLVIGDTDSDYHKCEIIAHTDRGVGLNLAVFMIKDYKGKSYYYSGCSAGYFKPLTPPVPLIDGKAYHFECDGFSDLNGIYSELDHSFYNHLGDSEVADCTNIQPLTLKGE